MHRTVSSHRVVERFAVPLPLLPSARNARSACTRTPEASLGLGTAHVSQTPRASEQHEDCRASLRDVHVCQTEIMLAATSQKKEDRDVGVPMGVGCYGPYLAEKR